MTKRESRGERVEERGERVEDREWKRGGEEKK